MRAVSCVAVFAWSTSLATVAYAGGGDGRAPAATPTAGPESPFAPRRYELAGFPIVGGNSDIGVQLGGAVTYTRFFDSVRPYLWNIDLLLSASLKDDQNGFRMVQQSHVLRLDAPGLLGGRLRLDSRASMQRTINEGYYGLGNATTAGVLSGQTRVGRSYEYLQQEGRLRAIARVHTGTLVDVALGANLRFESPETYDGSRLAEDLAAGTALGGEPMFLPGLAAGIIIDTRDSEFITRRGLYYQLGVGATAGTAQRIGYAEAAAVLAHYAPLGGPFVFASRFVASVQVGRVPFFDLEQGGVFEPQYLLGGESGVRGVPNGRYAGHVKVVANTEIRATPLPRVTLFGQHFLLGTTTFFDAGRVWDQPGVTSAADGHTLGLHYGIGGGLFLQWGEAAIFRIEAAYSPDAASENPGFPMGLYVSDGLMF